MATAVLPLLHVPPDTVSVSGLKAFWQNVVVPLTAPEFGAGPDVTLNVAVAVPQLLLTVYEIVLVPEATPVTTPARSIVIAAGLLLVQVPRPFAVVSESGAVELLQTVGEPVIVPATGNGLIVTAAVDTAEPQVVLSVYDIVAVPALTPVTTPAAFTVATTVLLLVQLPPDAVSVSVDVAP